MHGEEMGSWCHSGTALHIKLRLSLTWHEAVWGIGTLDIGGSQPHHRFHRYCARIARNIL